MPIVESSIVIHAPQHQLFALAQDYELRLEWDPFLREMRFLDGGSEATAGMHVRVRAWNGLTMEVEYTTVSPPDVVAMKMVKGPFFFEKFAGSWRFLPESDVSSRVLFRYAFTTRWPLLRPLLDPVIRIVFLRDIRARLRGLKRGAEETDMLERVSSLSLS
jgi:ribosome-associated toxin RatA of RatAB toxin-antitoxin module